MTSNSICRQTVTVNLRNGLHLVPCSLIARLAREYECDVTISKDELTIDAKNVFDLMTLNAGFGTQLVLEASGVGAADVVDGLTKLFESNFETDSPSAT